MENRDTNRSWTIAAAAAVAGMAALTFGLFLAVGKDSLAEDGEKTVRIVTVPGEDEEAVATIEAYGDDEPGGYLGLSLREYTKSDEGGALVKYIVDEGPAAKAGLKDGDVIINFGGDVVRGPARVTEKLRKSKSGDKVAVDVRRDGKVQKFTVELGKRPQAVWNLRSGSYAPLDEEQRKQLEKSLKDLDQQLPDLNKRIGKMKFYAPGRHGFALLGMRKPLLGIEMLETTPELRESMGGRKDAGVLVSKVLAGSAAEKGGVKVGDLILSVEGEKIADPAELGDALQKNEGKTVDLEIVRDKRVMHVKAVLPKIDEPEDEPTGPRASVWVVPAVAPPAPIPPPPPAPSAVAPLPPAPPAPPCWSNTVV